MELFVVSPSIKRAGKKFLMNGARNKLSVASSLFRYSEWIRGSLSCGFNPGNIYVSICAETNDNWVSQLYMYSEISHNQLPYFPLYLYSFLSCLCSFMGFWLFSLLFFIMIISPLSLNKLVNCGKLRLDRCRR